MNYHLEVDNTVAWLAQLDGYQTVVPEVEGSSDRVFKINRGGSASFAMTSALVETFFSDKGDKP